MINAVRTYQNVCPHLVIWASSIKSKHIGLKIQENIGPASTSQQTISQQTYQQNTMFFSATKQTFFLQKLKMTKRSQSGPGTSSTDSLLPFFHFFFILKEYFHLWYVHFKVSCSILYIYITHLKCRSCFVLIIQGAAVA